MSADVSLDMLLKKVPEAAEFMRLFGTPSRLTLLCHISQEERSVSRIQDDLGLKQPGLSQQLAELRQAGVVKTRRESRQIYYSIADARIAAVLDLLFALFCPTTSRNEPPKIDFAPTPPATALSTTQPDEAAHFARVDSSE